MQIHAAPFPPAAAGCCGHGVWLLLEGAQQPLASAVWQAAPTVRLACTQVRVYVRVCVRVCMCVRMRMHVCVHVRNERQVGSKLQCAQHQAQARKAWHQAASDISCTSVHATVRTHNHTHAHIQRGMQACQQSSARTHLACTAVASPPLSRMPATSSDDGARGNLAAPLLGRPQRCSTSPRRLHRSAEEE